LESLREAYIIYTQILISQALEPSFIASLLQEPGTTLTADQPAAIHITIVIHSSGHKPGILRDFSEHGKVREFCANSGKNCNKQSNFSSSFKYLCISAVDWVNRIITLSGSSDPALQMSAEILGTGVGAE